MTIFRKLGLLFSVTLLGQLPFTQGHGYVREVNIGTDQYTGYLPFSDPYSNPQPERIIRKIPGNGPVTNITLIDIQCNGYTVNGTGGGSAPAPILATVEAGSNVYLNWTTWPTSHLGPMITYMALAPSDITQWSPGSDSVWFKVAESGKTSDGKWAATDILSADDGIYNFTIPETLKAGQYIVRHEIIALHQAETYPGAQFYPSCIQLEVTGSGTALPTSFVSFPGAYTPTTPGVVYDVYNNKSVYPIPGPAVWTGD